MATHNPILYPVLRVVRVKIWVGRHRPDFMDVTLVYNVSDVNIQENQRVWSLYQSVQALPH